MMRLAAMALGLLTCLLAGCGQKGPLYLPDKTGEIVTRPAQTPAETTAAPDSPQTVDTPPAPAAPAAEVAAPIDPAKDKKDPKGPAVPPR
jgi:predicted small lipoprotein YifL